MNPISSDPTAPPPAPPPQPPRSSFSCDRHPTEQFNGFCPSCLCERLTSLDNSTSNTPSTSRRPSSVSAAIKSLFASNKANDFPPPQPKPTKPISIFPELRRTQSFSASKNEALSLGLVFEPQRKSCDVRNTLWSLFTIDDESKAGGVPVSIENKPSGSSSHQKNNIVVESFPENKPVFEESDSDEDYRDPENVDDVVGAFVEDDEIKSVSDSYMENCVEDMVKSGEIVEEEGVDLSNSLNSMKNHIDLDVQNGKKNSGGFWAAASVFSKKWQNWRKKQKVKKQFNVENLTTLPVEKPISRQFRETQSEIADYGFGRRSCDIDPRFSLDASRISFDGPRYSFDEPRASWDGHMIGRRSFSRMAVPPMVSVMEDVPISVPRADMQIPVEEPTMNIIDGGDTCEPGGSIQTREYYESFSKRRKSVDRKSVDRRSIDRSGSLRKTDIDEPRMAANVLESRDSNSNSLREDRSESFSRFRDGRNSLIGNGESKESKKSRRWGWRIFGFINRRNVGKDMDEDEKFSRVNGIGRSFSQSWQETGRTFSGDLRNGYSRNAFRSNSSVSWRNGEPIGGSFGSYEMNGNDRRKKNEFVLEKNRSVRFSPPDHIDNGLLRFFLAPMGSGRRGGSMGKIKQNNTHSIARSVLRIY